LTRNEELCQIDLWEGRSCDHCGLAYPDTVLNIQKYIFGAPMLCADEEACGRRGDITLIEYRVLLKLVEREIDVLSDFEKSWQCIADAERNDIVQDMWESKSETWRLQIARRKATKLKLAERVRSIEARNI
jgi:hypothetical protein